MKYYVISGNKTAHSVNTGEKKTVCGISIKPQWAKYTQTNDSKCEKCHTRKDEMKNV